MTSPDVVYWSTENHAAWEEEKARQMQIAETLLGIIATAGGQMPAEEFVLRGVAELAALVGHVSVKDLASQPALGDRATRQIVWNLIDQGRLRLNDNLMIEPL